MIDEFKEWKAKQEPFTDDNDFFKTHYTTFQDIVRGVFKEIYKLDSNQKVLANTLAQMLQEDEDDD